MNKFPAVYVSKHSGVKVRFTKECTGEVIVQGRSTFIVGFYCTSWASCFDTIIWEPENIPLKKPIKI